MLLTAVLKSETDNAPYRIYINDELITERYYVHDNNIESNNLIMAVPKLEEYDIQVESLTDTKVNLLSYDITELKKNENN